MTNLERCVQHKRLPSSALYKR